VIWQRSKVRIQVAATIYIQTITQQGFLMLNLIWTGVGVLIILWLLGVSVNIGGGLIHLLLVLALIGIVYNIFTGRTIG
jgi:Family of unknown function (DUF5670)